MNLVASLVMASQFTMLTRGRCHCQELGFLFSTVRSRCRDLCPDYHTMTVPMHPRSKSRRTGSHLDGQIKPPRPTSRHAADQEGCRSDQESCLYPQCHN
ncbi:hypothetical protein B0T14DRAFT_266307 [Immersiella caudata]|uniref:Uncharacterized protein n=1 Tax=Immersiella caudata TaxID=314043 RepID=A0AA40BXK6_9PEZI|nr:hypothetical protein B0T14DRAFT_266307 [Immersiella caudata]